MSGGRGPRGFEVIEDLLPEEIAVALYASDMPSGAEAKDLSVTRVLRWVAQGVERLGGNEVVQALAEKPQPGDGRSAQAVRAANAVVALAIDLEPTVVINAQAAGRSW
ncbi:hypothetical protein AB0C27_39535 [Nonomuraea sp. NPDC048882]|uniref:hypothetical protein n=1 Tax=Nonomuraea sp. NPDC048882 TaxID=3154347 RepID=UPI0033C9631A